MSRVSSRSFLLLIPVVAGLALAGATTNARGQASGSSTPRGEWPHYAADLRGTRYSPLDQIDASNFNKLEVAWRFKTDSLGSRLEYKLEGTPLMIDGVLYTTGGTRRSVVALDARTGELIWVHRYPEGSRATASPRQLSGRGVAYWTDGRGDERILYMTVGYRLIALNARTGALIGSFGRAGVIDLKIGAVKGKGEPIDLETGDVGINSTPTIAKDVVIVGSSMQEGASVPTHNNTKGLVRAYDVRTGKLLWTFHTIPKPGEFGNDTWENESWAVNGNTGVWTQITVDEELGLVYLPVETPTSDYYGGHRPGNNLFAESLVAVDLRTGQRRWHYQVVHHPIWNFDNCCAPILADITVDGRAIKAVALPSKQGWLYVFDRVTGQPVWPIEERPVPQSDVPGEKTSPTQPHPTRPPAYARNGIRVPDDLIDFTPELRAQALEIVKRSKHAPSPFTPPILGRVDGLLGTLGPGTATNWPGGGYDPETRTVYVHAANIGVVARSLVAPPPGFSDIRYVSGVAGREFGGLYVSAGFGTYADAPDKPLLRPLPEAAPASAGNLSVQGLPIVKPPYGVLSAIALDRGDLVWQVAHGDTPDYIRNHAALKGLNVPKTGQGEGQNSGGVGLVVTKTLVILGDGQVTTLPNRPRGAMLRAYDKKTGAEVGAVWMPAPQTGSPMTYAVGGKQYIVVAIGGGIYSAEYIAFSLPNQTPK